MSSVTFLKTDYHIGIITALPIERAAVTAMLDLIHDTPDDFDQSRDPNNYTWGCMGSHRVVIASLAAGVYGNTMATTTAMSMLHSFENIKFGLMVGIGAGIPTSRDVRLGDVVVSQPSGVSGGVFQYDLGKAKHLQWERQDFLARPPDVLLKALSKLQAEHEFRVPQAHEYLRIAFAKHEYWGQSYSRPTTGDYLFPSSYLHHIESLEDTCSACDPTQAIDRKRRPSEFRIHYGVIASGNSLVKDAELRDWIASMDKQCVCIEMEAAGLMNNFPCLVIRGICDYADSHKNDVWQRYACATAAALSKELLSFVPSADSKIASKAAEVLQITSSEHLRLKDGSQQAEDNISLLKAFPNDSTRSELPIRTIYTQNSASSDMSLNKMNMSGDLVTELESRIFSQYPFLKRGRVNARIGEKNDTLLHVSAREGRIELVTWLVEHGANIEDENEECETPFYIAAREGHLHVAKLLIEHGTNIEAGASPTFPNADGPSQFTPLHIAVREDRVNIVELLIEHKANIEAVAFVQNSEGARYHAPPLYIAAEEGHLDIVKLLVVDGGADIETTHEWGNTPLFIATFKGHLEVVNLLLECGADTEANPPRKTPLWTTGWKNYPDIAKLLLEYGANIEAKDGSGASPLTRAAMGGCLEMVKLFVEHKANIESKLLSGATPLCCAVGHGHYDVARYLLEKGANTNIIMSNPRLSLSVAARQLTNPLGRSRMLSLLSRYGIR